MGTAVALTPFLSDPFYQVASDVSLRHPLSMFPYILCGILSKSETDPIFWICLHTKKYIPGRG